MNSPSPGLWRLAFQEKDHQLCAEPANGDIHRIGITIKVDSQISLAITVLGIISPALEASAKVTETPCASV